MEAYRWIDTSISQHVPPTAVQGGIDVDGRAIYIGRANFRGDLLPAKIVPGRREAYISYDGHEHTITNFQILCETKFEWIQSSGSIIPQGAVNGGRTKNGETLYIGRVRHNNSQTIGKIHPSHRSCYIPFNGKEIAYKAYEILIAK